MKFLVFIYIFKTNLIFISNTKQKTGSSIIVVFCNKQYDFMQICITCMDLSVLKLRIIMLFSAIKVVNVLVSIGFLYIHMVKNLLKRYGRKLKS